MWFAYVVLNHITSKEDTLKYNRVMFTRGLYITLTFLDLFFRLCIVSLFVQVRSVAD